MNFLQLCQEFVTEVGINGSTGPGSVIGQTGELKNVVRWVRDGDVSTSLLWQDWRFLWRQHQPTLIESTLVPAITGGVKAQKWRRKLADGSSSFILNQDQPSWQPLIYLPWDQFHGKYDVGTIQQRRPTFITERPDMQLVLDAIPADPDTLSAEAWIRPVVMAANTSLPNVPEDFYRLLIARAMITYGGREDAPEILAAGEAEYIDLLEKLESRELEGQEARRSSVEDYQYHVEIT